MSNSDDSEQMSRALADAWTQLQASRMLNGDSEALAKAALARAILEAAENGVRDESKLTAYALSNYQRSRTAIQERDATVQPGPPGGSAT